MDPSRQGSKHLWYGSVYIPTDEALPTACIQVNYKDSASEEKTFTWACFLDLCLQLYANLNRVPSVVTFDSSMYCASHSVFFIIKYIIIQRHENLVEQFNCLISYEARQIPSSNMNISILGRMEKTLISSVQLCGISTGVVLSCAYSLMQLFVPCSPATFAYFLNPECTQLTGIPELHAFLSSRPVPIVVYPFAAATFTFWNTLDTLGMFAFVCMQLFFTQCYTLVYFIRLFRLEFLQKLNGSFCSSNIEKQLRKYKELQLHTLFFNQMHQDCIIFSVMWNVMYGFIISVFALAEYGSQLTFPQVVVFGNIAFATFIAMVVVYGIFAKVNSNSLKALAFLEQRVIPSIREHRKLRKWTKKYIASLPQLKIQLGTTNFVDGFTPLVMLQFCLGQLCNLRLM